MQVPEGQPLPRCRHCWSPLVAVSAPADRDRPASDGGLGALFEKYAVEATGQSGASDPSREACCPWCGKLSEPGLFCTDCGSPLLEVV